jgi:hypothetical protein
MTIMQLQYYPQSPMSACKSMYDLSLGQCYKLRGLSP